MLIPDNLIYTRDHQWVLKTQGSSEVVLGVTDFFQARMEEIIYVERPPEGDFIEEGEPIFLIESGKTVYEFASPLSGDLSEVNEMVIENPGLINSDPYGEGWLVKVRVKGDTWEGFLNPEEYDDFARNFSYPIPPAT